MKNKLKVGFDFDGVIADNPLKMLRLPANIVLKVFFHKKVLTYYPKSSLEQSFWRLIHRLSFFPSRGFGELKKLLKEGKVDAYLITGRYALLEHELHAWLKKHGIDDLFAGYFVNKQNEHPHEFKERMIKKLGLDVFVEDNWDIVKYLNSKYEGASTKSQKPIEIHWIYNFVDQFKQYERKHPHLKSFLAALRIRRN